jgi:hypothetical protein
MWDINYILDTVSKKTGLSSEEIRKTPWGELEEKLGVDKINLYKGRAGYLLFPKPNQILTREKYESREKECFAFIESFYKK